MLHRQRLIRAIDIQSRSYRLLKWIGAAIERGDIPLGRAERHSDTPDAAIDWFQQNYQLFPQELQPNREELRDFARFFWTYITTSFTVVPHPGTRLEPGDCGCLCPLCARIMHAPHLQPRKLRKSDKLRGQELMCERVAALAVEEGVPAAEQRVQRIVMQEDSRRWAGYSAYGQWLINRLESHSDGPSVLALWREIAWSRTGAPLRGFKLEFEDFVAAEEALVRALGRRPA